MTSTLNRNKHLCIHGHFYQPPRENPWTDEVDPEDSARPYRDWNARVARECYGPNAAGPVLDASGRIVDMADNYLDMSFNFGSTLLAWLEARQPALYGGILAADAESAKRRGHGNAVAQPYIHAILPLQTLRDKRTLVRWGLEDFKRRFGRDAEGLWLPETAVDEETLEVAAEAGVRFTILHPRQAARIRPVDGGPNDWSAVTQATLLPTRPYAWRSKRSKRQLAIFFFHKGLHDAVVGGEAFSAPETLFKKIFARTQPDDSTQLVNVAVDGEFFGHHHRKGAAALAQTFFLAKEAGLSIVNYAQFLDSFPPPQEVEVSSGTSWSCPHGVARWKNDCGCRSPHLMDWNQKWRGPMRESMDWLASKLDSLLERAGGRYFKDFWRARDRYAERLGDSSPEAASAFLAREALMRLSEKEATEAFELLECQRHRLAMFTSCGWFFDDISGIEAGQCLKHAGRAVELAARFGEDHGPELKQRLGAAASNLERVRDGAKAYELLVEPASAGPDRAAAHWAVLEHLHPGLARMPAGWRVEAEAGRRRDKIGSAGRDRSLSARRLTVTRASTLERSTVTAVVHRRDRLDVACRLGPPDLDAAPLLAAFESGDDAAVERALNGSIGARFWTLEALFAEDRAEALRWLVPDPAGGPARRQLLERWVEEMSRLRAGLGGDECLDLLLEAKRSGQPPDLLPWVCEARRRLSDVLEAVLMRADEPALTRAGRWLEVFETCGLHVDVWELQHLFWRWRAKIRASDGVSPAERSLAVALGEKLGFADTALPLGATA